MDDPGLVPEADAYPFSVVERTVPLDTDTDEPTTDIDDAETETPLINRTDPEADETENCGKLVETKVTVLNEPNETSPDELKTENPPDVNEIVDDEPKITSPDETMEWVTPPTPFTVVEEPHTNSPDNDNDVVPCIESVWPLSIQIFVNEYDPGGWLVVEPVL